MRDGDYAVAFGHHTNKNVDLVLDAWMDLVRGDQAPHLRLTGVPDEHRAIVEMAVAERRLGARVTVLPFLASADFERLFAQSGLIVFPSDFEGFGLPVIETMRLGKPVVVGPDEAVLEVAAGHATVMAKWTSAALSAAVGEALCASPARLEAARDYATGFTWARATSQSRAAMLAARDRRS